MMNLKLLGAEVGDLSRLSDIVELTSSSCGYPFSGLSGLGRDTFRTGTGVHAAVIKAQQRGDDWLPTESSGVPAAWFGRRQEIEVGHYSGMSNVKAWLISRGLEPPRPERGHPAARRARTVSSKRQGSWPSSIASSKPERGASRSCPPALDRPAAAPFPRQLWLLSLFEAVATGSTSGVLQRSTGRSASTREPGCGRLRPRRAAARSPVPQFLRRLHR